MAYMIAAAGFPDKCQIPLELCIFTGTGNPGKTKLFTADAFVHAGVRLAIAHILGMGSDDTVNITALLHGRLHHIRCCHTNAVITEGMNPHGAQSFHITQLLTRLRLCDTGIGNHMHTAIMVVKPPWAAAAVPLAIVSLCA